MVKVAKATAIQKILAEKNSLKIQTHRGIEGFGPSDPKEILIIF